MEKDDAEDKTDQLLADPQPTKKSDCKTVTDVLELDQIEQEYEMDEEAGASITPQLAKVVTTIAKSKLSEEKLKAKLEKHKRLENLELVVVPEVNPESGESWTTQ